MGAHACGPRGRARLHRHGNGATEALRPRRESGETADRAAAHFNSGRTAQRFQKPRAPKPASRDSDLQSNPNRLRLVDRSCHRKEAFIKARLRSKRGSSAHRRGTTGATRRAAARRGRGPSGPTGARPRPIDPVLPSPAQAHGLRPAQTH